MDKPYPVEGNFVRGDASLGEGRIETPADNVGQGTNHFGQVKYARREGAPSIYKDATRQTQNDKDASAKAEGSSICESYEEENEESQGI